MARVTSNQIRGIILGKEHTYPTDLRMWVGTLGVVGRAPFYLTADQLRWFEAYIQEGRRQLRYRQRFRMLSR